MSEPIRTARDALSKIRELLSMPTGQITDVVVRASDEIERLQKELAQTQAGQADLAEARDEIEQLREELRLAYCALGPDYDGEWELGDKRRPLDSLVSEAVAQLGNANVDLVLRCQEYVTEIKQLKSKLDKIKSKAHYQMLRLRAALAPDRFAGQPCGKCEACAEITRFLDRPGGGDEC